MRPNRERLQTLYRAHGDKLRFLVVGGWNTAFSYGLFVALVFVLGPVLRPLAHSSQPVIAALGVHWYLVVQWAAWIVAVPQSTIALKYLVFHSKGHLPTEIGRSFFVYLPLQAASSVSLWALVSLVHLHPLVGQLITIPASSILSYIGNKYFTFKQPEQPDDPLG